MAQSTLEKKFIIYWKRFSSYAVPASEVKFHPTRRWRFDFAFPAQKLAIELEGGVWTRGRHTRGGGFIEDCNKYNAAIECGWTVLRYTSDHLKNPKAVIEQIERVLEGKILSAPVQLPML